MIHRIARCPRWTPAILSSLLSSALFLLASCEGNEGTKPLIPACELTPPRLEFGSIRVGRTKDLTFTIKNIGGGTLTGDVSESCDAFSIAANGGGYSLREGEERTVTVRLAPTAPGSQTCTVSLGSGACGSLACTGVGSDQPPPEMMLVPAGTFTMGSPSGELQRSTDEPQHQVTLTKAFYVSKYEVTQAEWQDVMGWNPSHFSGSNHPVDGVTWYDATSYCNQMSALDGHTPAYTITGMTYGGRSIIDATVTWDQAADGYRLLTEAEWEYACRATSTTAFCNGDITTADCAPLDLSLDLVAWYCGNASGTTHDVGGKAPNAWGLSDMHGNVYEWCWDWYGAYGGTVTDPFGPPSGSTRILRGGGWNCGPQFCRSASRSDAFPSFRFHEFGLRFARTAL